MRVMSSVGLFLLMLFVIALPVPSHASDRHWRIDQDRSAGTPCIHATTVSR